MTPYYEADGITIYHGDCREVLPSFPDASVDFIFTDPPYGHNNNNNGDLIHRREEALGMVKRGTAVAGAARPIANDGPEANDLVRWAFAEFFRLLAPGSCCCCCCGGGGPDPLEGSSMTDGGDVVLNEEYDELGDNGVRRMALWVDDSKPVPHWFDAYSTAEARTYDDALALLRRFTYHTLYLDHDLGDAQGRTGLDLLRVIQAEGRCPRRVICISWNPVGRANIEAALEQGA